MRKDVLKEVRRMIKESLNSGLKLNKAAIARRMNCDPRTVGEQIKIALGEKPTKTYKSRGSKLDPFKPIIDEKLDLECTYSSIYQFILKKGFTGKYTIVREYCHNKCAERVKKATIRFESCPGLQAQVDWKESVKLISKSGEEFEFNIFLMILGFSRTKYIEFTLDRNQQTLKNCIINACKYFGGVPHEVIFDNMRTVVDHVKSDLSQTKYNPSFYQFSKDMGFSIWACRPYRPQTKGKVEALAKLVDRINVFNKEFDTVDELIKIINTIRDDINGEISQATGKPPLELLIKEREFLLSMPTNDIIDSYLNSSTVRKVSKESMIVYMNKKYSLDPNYIGKYVEIKEDNRELLIYYNGLLISQHELSKEKFNYHKEDVVKILKSDVMKNRTDEDIENFINKNISMYDLIN